MTVHTSVLLKNLFIAGHTMPGGNVCNSFLEPLPPRKRKISRARSHQSVKALSEENCSILNTWRRSCGNARISNGQRRWWFYALARSLRCGPFKAPSAVLRENPGTLALSSGDSHDRGVEFPYRCDLHGTTVVVKIFEGHPQDLHWQGYRQFTAVLGVELKAMFR